MAAMRAGACILVVLWTASARAAEPATAQPPSALTNEQAGRLIDRLLEREAFWPRGFQAARPETLNRFFDRDDYQVLRGNPFLGYWNSGAFRWVGRRIAWGGIAAGTGDARAISSRAWRLAFDLVARQRGLVVDGGATIRVSGACVAANLQPSEERGPPGVVVELLVESPTGPLRYRLSVGKPSVEEAMGALLDWALSFAMRVNQQQRPSEAPRTGSR